MNLKTAITQWYQVVLSGHKRKKIMIGRNISKMYWIILIILIKCVPYKDKQVERVRLSGINGEAYYIFKNDNTVWGMYKVEHNNADYQVMLYGDTVYLGTDFEAMINVPKPEFKITVSRPSREIILKNSTRGSREYRFTPDREGIFDFQGTIEYDTTKIPFEYKFIVVKKD